MAQPLRLVIFGRQGAGKGTQCIRLIERYNVVHISTGDMLRAEVAADTELGRKAAEIMASGGLVDDETILGVAQSRISQDDVKAHGFVLDGFPRTIEQAAGLIAALGDHALDAVIDLDVPLGEVTKRMKLRARADDTDEAIAKRLALYEEQTQPVLQFFADRGLLVRVDGLGTEEQVTERLYAAVDAQIEAGAKANSGGCE